ncbi:MAG: phage integrase N-terminal SAM-like domain-containing protein [Candidatus Binatia bacterium]
MRDRVRLSLRARYYSRRTDAAYAAWIQRFILFHGKRPGEEGMSMNPLCRRRSSTRLPAGGDAAAR